MYAPKPSLRDYVVTALLGVAPLVGCGKEPVNPSILENKVANAQTINGADSKGEELDLSTPEKAAMNYLEAFSNADYDALVASTTGDLNNLFISKKEISIQQVRESLEKTHMTPDNIVKSASQQLSSDTAVVEYLFDPDKVSIPGQNGLTLRLKKTNGSWKVYDQ